MSRDTCICNLRSMMVEASLLPGGSGDSVELRNEVTRMMSKTKCHREGIAWEAIANRW